jgi:hypothetical protein
MSALSVYINGIGLLGPGFANWAHGTAVLRDDAAYEPQPTLLPLPARLPPAERRRAGRVIKLALAVGLEAAEQAGENPAELATIFTSSGGDGHNCHELCQVLATADRQLSPTRFHNSVHNVAAGYWSIATGSMAPSNVLCAFDASFAAGLLEATTQVVVNRATRLLLAYDTEYPDPLHHKRPIPDAFGVALLLAPQAGARSLARLEVSLADVAGDRMRDARIETLRTSTPAARSLPLLRQLALGEPGRVAIDYLEPTSVSLQVTPCG